jgi:hypothetical protein
VEAIGGGDWWRRLVEAIDGGDWWRRFSYGHDLHVTDAPHLGSAARLLVCPIEVEGPVQASVAVEVPVRREPACGCLAAP